MYSKPQHGKYVHCEIYISNALLFCICLSGGVNNKYSRKMTFAASDIQRFSLKVLIASEYPFGIPQYL